MQFHHMFHVHRIPKCSSTTTTKMHTFTASYREPRAVQYKIRLCQFLLRFGIKFQLVNKKKVISFVCVHANTMYRNYIQFESPINLLCHTQFDSKISLHIGKCHIFANQIAIQVTERRNAIENLFKLYFSTKAFLSRLIFHCEALLIQYI